MMLIDSPARRLPTAMALVGTVALLAACSSAEASGAGCAGQDLTAHRKATVQRVFDEVLNRGDYGLFATDYLPTFVKHVDGKDATLAQEIDDARATRAIASDLVMTVDGMVADGALVAVRYTGRGTHDGPGLGMPPTGRAIALQGMTMYWFEGCRIAEEWTVYNALHLLEQIGVYPPAARAGTGRETTNRVTSGERAVQRKRSGTVSSPAMTVDCLHVDVHHRQRVPGVTERDPS